MLSEPWVTQMRPRSWDEFADPDNVYGSVKHAAIETPDTLACFMLFGKPGRGKTTLATLIGKSGPLFVHMNGSSERQGSVLRAILECFARDALCQAPDALATLLIDEADGLGQIGQWTVVSFLAELEERLVATSRAGHPLPRIRVIVCCNDVGEIISTLGSRCFMVPFVRPSQECLTSACRTALAKAGVTKISDQEIRAVVHRAAGDFRTAMHMLEVASVEGTSQGPWNTLIPPGFAKLRSKDADLVAVGRYTRDEIWPRGFLGGELADWVEQLLGTVDPTDMRRREALLELKHALVSAPKSTLLSVWGALARIDAQPK